MEISVVAIGDSITAGFPYTPRESWVFLAALRLGIPILNKGISGDLTGPIRARFARDVLTNQPTHTIIMGGTNDAFFNLPREAACNNIYRMCEQAEEAGIQPILGIPIPVNEIPAENWLRKFRGWLRDYACRQGYQVLDFYAALADQETGWLRADCHEDGVHPNILGYRTMAEIVRVEVKHEAT